MHRVLLVVAALLTPLFRASAQVGDEGPTAGTRRAGPAEAPLEVVTLRVAPGVITTVMFAAPFDSEAMDRELGRLSPLLEMAEPGSRGRLVTLLPSAAFVAGMRQRWEVRFSDGKAPSSVVLELVSGSVMDAERQVRVGRAAPTSEVLQERISALERRTATCESELKEARGEMSLANLIAHGALRGSVVKHESSLQQTENGDGALTVRFAAIHVTNQRVIVSFVVTLAADTLPWVPGAAEVRQMPEGQPLRVLAASFERARLEPATKMRVALEIERQLDAPRAIAIRLQEASGPRTLRLEGSLPQGL